MSEVAGEIIPLFYPASLTYRSLRPYQVDPSHNNRNILFQEDWVVRLMLYEGGLIIKRTVLSSTNVRSNGAAKLGGSI